LIALVVVNLTTGYHTTTTNPRGSLKSKRIFGVVQRGYTSLICNFWYTTR